MKNTNKPYLYTQGGDFALRYKWAIVEAAKPWHALTICKDLDEAMQKWRGYRPYRKFNIIVAITPENREV
jgi:hypothetical protein